MSQQWVTDAEQERESISVLLAGPPARVTSWYQALMADKRFRVGSFANDSEDLQRKLGNRPQVIIIDATIFGGPQPLINLLVGVEGAAYVVLPPDVPEDIMGSCRKSPR